MTQKKQSGNQIVVKNNQVITILDDDTLCSGVLDLEEAKRLLKESVRRIYEMNNAL